MAGGAPKLPILGALPKALTAGAAPATPKEMDPVVGTMGVMPPND